MSEVIAEGRISALYRCPVKSMQGEQLPELQLTERGVDGDRVLALLDRTDGLVASAHHPAKWDQLLHCRARTTPDCKVWATPPGGRELPAGAELERELGTLLGQDVRLISSAPAGGAYEIIHPDIPDTAPPQFVKYTLNLAGAQRAWGASGSRLKQNPAHWSTSLRSTSSPRPRSPRLRRAAATPTPADTDPTSCSTST